MHRSCKPSRRTCEAYLPPPPPLHTQNMAHTQPQVIMNPLHSATARITNREFDRKVKLLAKRLA